MKVGLLLGAAFVGFSGAAACSSFQSTTDPSGAAASASDAGDGPASLTGTSTGQVSIAIDVAPVIHGRKANVHFTVTRGYNYDASVTVRAEGLPTTVTSQAVVIDGSATDGELNLDIGSDTPYGKINGASVVAIGNTDDAPSARQPWEPEVRGAPGELDTSFASAGVLAIDNSDRGSEFAVDTLGRILALNNVGLRRFNTDGRNIDPSFTALSFTSARALYVAQRGSNIFVARNKPVTDNDTTAGATTGARLWRLNENGVPDANYGANGFANSVDYDETALQIGNDGGGLGFTFLGDPAYQVAFSPAGQAASGITKSQVRPSFIRGVVFLKDNSVVAAGNHSISKLLADNQNIDTLFGTSGFYDFDSTLHINDLVADANGNYLVAGHLDSGHLYVGRVTSAGKTDASFHPQTSSFTVTPESLKFDIVVFAGTTVSVPLVGKLYVASSGLIYAAAQVTDGGKTKCIVSRFLTDGTPDDSFGTNGSTSFAAPNCYAHRIVPQGDGKVLVGGPVIMRFWE